MTQMNQSTIVQLLFCETPRMNFAGLVTELEIALEQASAGQCAVDWDHDDIVVFEADKCRFVLAYCAQPSQHIAACLTLSVGPASGFQTEALPILTEAACRMIIKRLDLRYAPDHQHWHSVSGPVGADEIDALNEALGAVEITPSPPDASIAPIADLVPLLTRKAEADGDANCDFAGQDTKLRPFPVRPQSVRSVSQRTVERRRMTHNPRVETVTPLRTPDRFERALVRKLRATTGGQPVEPVVPETANDMPDLPSENDQVITRVRAALYPAVDEKFPMSTQLRLAAHSMDATLIIVALPVGAAMLTYSLLRGGNANISGRMMAITCTLVGLSQTGFAGSLAGFL